ncbi:MAG: hypothetical protein AB7Q91_14140 [Phycisphaerales bacterium]
MMNLSDIEAVLRRVDPPSVARFLSKRGYKRTGGKAGVVDVFAGTTGDVLLLPLKQDDRDYARRLHELAELFTTATTTLDDVVGSIVLPDSDIFRYRIETPETAWGHLRLNYTHEAMHALFDLLQYTAAGVSSQRTDYRNVSESAKAFAEQCRFGQTEYGSFVLKVFCPTNPIGVRDDLGEPFGRVTTRAVVENLVFLAGEKSEDPSEPLPPTLNRNVASAVERLRPRVTLGATTEVRMRYSPLTDETPGLVAPVVPSIEEVASLDLGPFIFSRAQRVRDRLKKAEEFERELLRGHITDLHKDRPTSEHEQSHEVTLEVKFGLSWRQLRVRLLPRQYRDAMHWQDQNLLIDVDALIDKRSRVWSVAQIFGFRPADRGEGGPGLFDAPNPDPPPTLIEGEGERPNPPALPPPAQ